MAALEHNLPQSTDKHHTTAEAPAKCDALANGRTALPNVPTKPNATASGHEVTPGAPAKCDAAANGHLAPLPPDRDSPQWREALALVQSIPATLRPTDAQLITLARACTEPRHLRLLLEAFARHAAALAPDAPSSQHPYPLLCDFVDDSNHDLREWVNALAVFNDWLCEQQRPPQSLSMLLPYLSCSAEAQANSPMPLPLPHIVADMLEQYGYEGS